MAMKGPMSPLSLRATELEDRPPEWMALIAPSSSAGPAPPLPSASSSNGGAGGGLKPRRVRVLPVSHPSHADIYDSGSPGGTGGFIGSNCWAAFWRVVHYLFPCTKWMAAYSLRDDLVADLIAGISVGVMLVPQSMSYAKLAGLPPIYGLYSAFVPILSYVVFGSSRQLAVGPVAIVSILTFDGLRKVVAEKLRDSAVAAGLAAAGGFGPTAGLAVAGGLGSTAVAGGVVGGIELPAAELTGGAGGGGMLGGGVGGAGGAVGAADVSMEELAVLLALMVGLLEVLMGLLRMGWLVRFLSHSVVSGFTSGAALLVCVSVAKDILGFSMPGAALLVCVSVAKDILRFSMPGDWEWFDFWGQALFGAEMLSCINPHRSPLLPAPHPSNPRTHAVRTAGQTAFAAALLRRLKSPYSPPPTLLIPALMPYVRTAGQTAFAAALSHIIKQIVAGRAHWEPMALGGGALLLLLLLQLVFFQVILSTFPPTAGQTTFVAALSHIIKQIMTTFVAALSHIIKQIMAGRAHWEPMALGGGALLLLLLMKEAGKSWKSLQVLRCAGPFTSIVLGALVVKLWRPQHVPVVGEIPQGLPSLSTAFPWEYFPKLLPTALVITGVAILESCGIAKALAARNGYAIDANQELFGLGMANVLGSFFSSFPTTGEYCPMTALPRSFSRSAVNNEVGARTALSGLIMALMVVATLLFLTPAFRDVPQCVLAAVVVNAVHGLVDLQEPLFLWRVEKKDLVLWLCAFLGTLLLGLETGVLISVALSLVFVIHESANPHMAVLGRLPGTTVYRNVKQYRDAYTYRGVVILRIDAPIYFANVDYIKERLRKYELQRVAWWKDGSSGSSGGRLAGSNGGANGMAVMDLRFLILEMSPVTYIDSTAVHALKELYNEYKARDIQLCFSNPSPKVMLTMARAGFPDLIGRQWYFVRIHDAVQVSFEHEGGGERGALGRVWGEGGFSNPSPKVMLTMARAGFLHLIDRQGTPFTIAPSRSCSSPCLLSRTPALPQCPLCSHQVCLALLEDTEITIETPSRYQRADSAAVRATAAQAGGGVRQQQPQQQRQGGVREERPHTPSRHHSEAQQQRQGEQQEPQQEGDEPRVILQQEQLQLQQQQQQQLQQLLYQQQQQQQQQQQMQQQQQQQQQMQQQLQMLHQLIIPPHHQQQQGQLGQQQGQTQSPERTPVWEIQPQVTQQVSPTPGLTLSPHLSASFVNLAQAAQRASSSNSEGGLSTVGEDIQSMSGESEESLGARRRKKQSVATAAADAADAAEDAAFFEGRMSSGTTVGDLASSLSPFLETEGTFQGLD
ncbi:unnamed protein product [Closterium sp. Yama58-4]|nr:unnamed protein product [Closterium sp. Yama58-4]